MIGILLNKCYREGRWLFACIAAIMGSFCWLRVWMVSRIDAARFEGIDVHLHGEEWVVLAGLTLLSGSFTIRVPSLQARISVSETFVFTSVLLFGAASGTIIVAIDTLIAAVNSRRRPQAIRTRPSTGARPVGSTSHQPLSSQTSKMAWKSGGLSW